MQDIEDIANVAKAELDQCKNVSDVKKIKVKDIAEKIKNAKVRPISVDIALFGRMVTSEPTGLLWNRIILLRWMIWYLVRAWKMRGQE